METMFTVIIDTVNDDVKAGQVPVQKGDIAFGLVLGSLLWS